MHGGKEAAYRAKNQPARSSNPRLLHGEEHTHRISSLSLQVPIEPFYGPSHGIYLVFTLDEPVTLIRVVMRVYYTAVFLQNINHLLGFLLGICNVVLALKNEQWRLRVLEVFSRNAFSYTSRSFAGSPKID